MLLGINIQRGVVAKSQSLIVDLQSQSFELLLSTTFILFRSLEVFALSFRSFLYSGFSCVFFLIRPISTEFMVNDVEDKEGERQGGGDRSCATGIE